MSSQNRKYRFTTKSEGDRQMIFDIVRKKYVVLTPEESVRQYLIHHLVYDLGYPKSLIAVEKQVVVNSLVNRADIIVYNKAGRPLLLIECKSPDIPISQAASEQAARYNLSLGVKYLAISNGNESYCWQIDHQSKQISLLAQLPRCTEE